MYYFFTEQVQRTLISEIRRYWQYHPETKAGGKYEHLIDNIQGKYSFRERPQQGIILKNSSGNQVQLAADNFQGFIESYVFLGLVEGYPGISLEWVRENALAIQQNDGFFPSPAGVYYIELCDRNQQPSDSEFFVDPLLNVNDETLLKVNDTTYQLLQGKFLEDALRLYRMPGNIQLIDFEANPETGIVTLEEPLQEGEFLSADYRYPGESTGPWKLQDRRGRIEAIPGVVLGFGNRITPGDRLAVVVQEKRSLASMEFGGRWDFSIDMDVIARDVHHQREILDQTCLYLWGVARARLSTKGIELSQVSMGGESEEEYDSSGGGDMFYTGSISLQIQTDWAIHVPIPTIIRRVLPGVDDDDNGSSGSALLQKIAHLPDEDLVDLETNIQNLEQLGVKVRDPFFFGKGLFEGKNATFPMLR